MVTFQEGLVDNVRQGLCNTLNIAQRTAQLGERFYDSVGLRGVGQASGQAAQLWGNAAGVACNRQPEDLSQEVQVPFTGGQCPGSLYDGFWQVRFPPGNPLPVQNFTGRVGPISLVRRNTDTQQLVNLFDGNGNSVLGAGTVLTAEPIEILQLEVNPQPGQPNDCGDPPAQGLPYNPTNFTLPRTINFDDNQGNPQSLDVDLVFKPVVTNNGGDFVVPIEVEFEDGSSLFGDFNFSTGDINFGGGNSGGDGVQEDPVELDEDQDEAPDGTVIVGVRITAGVNPAESRATEIFTPSGQPNLFVPRLGIFRFRYQPPGSAVSIGPDIDIKSTENVYWSGPPAIGVELFAETGTTFARRLIVVPETAAGLYGGGGST